MINIARDVNKAVEEVNTIPMLGFINDIADVDTALPLPTKISVIINNTFLYSNFYIFSYNSHYLLLMILIYFRNHVFLFDVLSFLFHHLLFIFLTILVRFLNQDSYSFINQKNVFLTNLKQLFLLDYVAYVIFLKQDF